MRLLALRVATGAGSARRAAHSRARAAGSKSRQQLIRADMPSSELLFGVWPVKAALAEGRRIVYGAYLQSDYDDDLPRIQHESICETLRASGVPFRQAPKAALDGAVARQAHQGVVLKVGRYDPPRVRSVTPLADGRYCVVPAKGESIRHKPRRRLPLWLYLDEIQDPHNLGSMLRSALFFGADAVLTPAQHVCRTTPLVSKISAGAMEALALYRTAVPLDFLRGAQAAGWAVVCASPSGAPAPAPLPPLPPPLARPTILVIGGEAYGVSKDIEDLADARVHIPAPAALPPHADSLNAGVAAGILLSQLRFSGE
ncbi:Ribose methyltransferase [Coemansia javaensis]|uniref:rRNA methyltransferase 1, mitochondrial n=1 Tax=Coemansia javaensis TaxID=2761396 RepID=A0A9W8LH46_9FUNG|nr:Ribose methyltransferase [Coemansia javaensis]